MPELLRLRVILRILLGGVFAVILPGASLAQSGGGSISVAGLGATVSPTDTLLAEAIKRQLMATLPKLSAEDAGDGAAVHAYYTRRNYAPLWVTETGLMAKTPEIIATLNSAEAWGLRQQDFAISPFGIAGDGSIDLTIDNERLATTEVAISLAVVKYARHAQGGRIPDPAVLTLTFSGKPTLPDPTFVLESLMGKSDPKNEAENEGRDDIGPRLLAFHPKHPRFHALQQALEGVLRAERQPTFLAPRDLLPVQGPALVPGQKHADIVILRRRLGLMMPTAVIGTPVDPAVYDADLATAVRAFQKEKGLSPAHGVLTQATRAAINAPPPKRAAKLIAAMEAWRWMPDDLGEFYIEVDLPAFTIRVVKAGTVIHEDLVAVGAVGKSTPVFSGVLEKIIVRPPPGARNLSSVLQFAIVGPPRISLLDSPNPAIFDKARRTFGRGDIWVRNSQQLAELVLAHCNGWDAARVADVIRTRSQTAELPLDKKIPVHVTYFTARVADDGTLDIFPDVYGHEERIIVALEGQASLLPKTPNPALDSKPAPSSRQILKKTSKNVPTASDSFFAPFFFGGP